MNSLVSEEHLLLKVEQKVTSADTDMIARLRVGALVNFLIQSAIDSADQLGFGFDKLREQSLFWVMNRLTLEIEKPLMWNEHCIVETWPKDLEKILYIRDFVIKDNTGNSIVKATSGWLAVDIERKRPRLVQTIHENYFTDLAQKHALAFVPEKLNGVAEGEFFECKTEFSDYDLNGHVTSTRYIDWMMNTFNTAYHLEHYPRKISVNFMKETMPDDLIQLKRVETDKNCYLFEGINRSNGAIAFRGYIGF